MSQAVLEAVVAVAENDVIGRDNRLPWRLSADLRRFKRLTLGHAVLMGRRTYESIGRPLPERTNIILSRRAAFTAPPGCLVVGSLEAAIEAAGNRTSLMVIGGAQLLREALPRLARIHLTLVHASPPGDTYFTDWRGAQWLPTARESHASDAANEYAYSFITLERASPS